MKAAVLQEFNQPLVVADVTVDSPGPGEVVVQPAPRDWGWAVEAIDPRPLVIAFRLPEDRDVTGRLVVPNADSTGMVALRFRVDGDERHADSEVEFLTHQLAHLRALVDQGMPGTAWFRHEARRVEAALREIDPARADALLVQAQNRRPGGTSDIERTYALVTGGLAVAENLQLDRELAAATKGTRDVDVATVAGITVREYDWSTLTKDLHPAADPLAMWPMEVTADTAVTGTPVRWWPPKTVGAARDGRSAPRRRYPTRSSSSTSRPSTRRPRSSRSVGTCGPSTSRRHRRHRHGRR